MSSPPLATVRGHERHLERRHEGLGLAVGGVGQLDVVGEAARRGAGAVGHLADGRRQVERDAATRTRAARRSRRARRRRSRGRSARTRCCTTTSVAPIEVEGAVAGLGMVAVADAEAIDDEALLLGARLLLVGRLGRDRTRAQPGDGGHDLEHRARDVPAERRARQERLAVVRAQRLERLLGGRRVGDRRGVVGRGRGERQDLARCAGRA